MSVGLGEQGEDGRRPRAMTEIADRGKQRKAAKQRENKHPDFGSGKKSQNHGKNLKKGKVLESGHGLGHPAGCSRCTTAPCWPGTTASGSEHATLSNGCGLVWTTTPGSASIMMVGTEQKKNQRTASRAPWGDDEGER